MYKIVSRVDAIKSRANRTGVQEVSKNHFRSRTHSRLEEVRVPCRATDTLTGLLEEREQSPTDVTAGAGQKDEFFLFLDR
jgi:hypothetical protein